MDERAALPASAFSPYHLFSRAQWAELRPDTPLTLSSEDLARLRSINEPITLEEVIEIYLPLSRLLSLYVAATQGLFKATQRFLGADDGKMPYIIGVARLGGGRQIHLHPRHAGPALALARTRRGSSSSPRTGFCCPMPCSSAKG